MPPEDSIKLSLDLEELLNDIADKRRAGTGVRAMADRRGEFQSEAAMKLAGAAMVPEARAMVDDMLTQKWDRRRLVWSGTDEVVIGSGYHAAVYCSARVRAGYPKPYVLERAPAERVGGVFAMTVRPSFYLNSENRPGTAGYPSDGDALNYFPGGILQPSQVSAREFPDNEVMRWLIRVHLAQFARVCAATNVTGLSFTDYSGILLGVPYYSTSSFLRAARVVDARGTGDERGAGTADGERIMTFSQLLQQADQVFPFRGMRRVAVIGDGDSAKCAVEALTGIGPDAGMRTMELDGAPRVDWYAQRLPQDNKAWRDNQRGRYQRLGSYLPLQQTNIVEYTTDDDYGNTQENRDEFTYTADSYHDVTVIGERGTPVRAGSDVLVNGRVYTHAVLCTGSELKPLLSADGTLISSPGQEAQYNSRALAKQFNHNGALAEMYAIGPAAEIDFDRSEREQGMDKVPENRVAMFRLGGRTAQLAASLPSVP